MRRAGYLLERVAERSNLAAAFWKAARGRRNSAGARRFSGDLDRWLGALSRRIQKGDAPAGGYIRFTVFDPKERVIHAAPFEQRVLHHAIMNVCGPLFERGAVPESCACRVGQGNRAALDLALRHTRRHACFLKMDVRRFFDSVDHSRLKARFRRVFKDEALLLLLDRIVESYQTELGKGLPIGALTSQYFANFYLDPFDRFVKGTLGCRAYVRFMDDFALWDDSEARLSGWRDDIQRWLKESLALDVKAGTRLLPSARGMPFLGFRVTPRALLLDRRGRRRFVTRLAGYQRLLLSRSMGEGEFQRRAAALMAHTDWALCRSWRRRAVERVMAVSSSSPRKERVGRGPGERGLGGGNSLRE